MLKAALKNLNFSAVNLNKSQALQLPGQGVVTASRAKATNVADILDDTQALRSGNLKAPSRSLFSKISDKSASYFAGKKDAAANKQAFSELAPQTAVTPKIVNTQPSVESLLADSSAVRDGLYKGPSIGAKIVGLFGQIVGGVKKGLVGFGSAMASLVGAILGGFSKVATAVTKKSETNKASKELVGNDFVQETLSNVQGQKSAAMKKALAEAENLAFSQLIQGKIVAEMATQSVELKSPKN